MAEMECVIEYEKTQGRVPKDVSREFRGCDIISVTDEEKRYIEVKSVADSGILELIENEWVIASKVHNDYWLYIVESATDTNKRKLYIIQNPVNKLKDHAIKSKEGRIKVKNWKDHVDKVVN